MCFSTFLTKLLWDGGAQLILSILYMILLLLVNSEHCKKKFIENPHLIGNEYNCDFICIRVAVSTWYESPPNHPFLVGNSTLTVCKLSIYSMQPNVDG